MKTLHLSISILTGNDDLRRGSWADFRLKIEGNPIPLEARQFTGVEGLAPRSSRRFDLRFIVPDSFEPRQIESVEIRHVTQEGSGQTADNWDLRMAVIDIVPTPQPGVRVGSFGAHRFDGRSRVLTAPSAV